MSCPKNHLWGIRERRVHRQIDQWTDRETYHSEKKSCSLQQQVATKFSFREKNLRFHDILWWSDHSLHVDTQMIMYILQKKKRKEKKKERWLTPQLLKPRSRDPLTILPRRDTFALGRKSVHLTANSRGLSLVSHIFSYHTTFSSMYFCTTSGSSLIGGYLSAFGGFLNPFEFAASWNQSARNPHSCSCSSVSGFQFSIESWKSMPTASQYCLRIPSDAKMKTFYLIPKILDEDAEKTDKPCERTSLVLFLFCLCKLNKNPGVAIHPLRNTRAFFLFSYENLWTPTRHCTNLDQATILRHQWQWISDPEFLWRTHAGETWFRGCIPLLMAIQWNLKNHRGTNHALAQVTLPRSLCCYTEFINIQPESGGLKDGFVSAKRLQW